MEKQQQKILIGIPDGLTAKDMEFLNKKIAEIWEKNTNEK